MYWKSQYKYLPIYMSPFQEHFLDIYEISKGKCTFEFINKFLCVHYHRHHHYGTQNVSDCLIKTQHTTVLWYGDCPPL